MNTSALKMEILSGIVSFSPSFRWHLLLQRLIPFASYLRFLFTYFFVIDYFHSSSGFDGRYFKNNLFPQVLLPLNTSFDFLSLVAILIKCSLFIFSDFLCVCLLSYYLFSLILFTSLNMLTLFYFWQRNRVLIKSFQQEESGIHQNGGILYGITLGRTRRTTWSCSVFHAKELLSLSTECPILLISFDIYVSTTTCTMSTCVRRWRDPPAWPCLTSSEGITPSRTMLRLVNFNTFT